MLSLIRCERSMLLLVNEDAADSGTGVFSRVFDLEAADLDNDAVTTPFEGRFPLNTGITRYVAATGKTVNLADAYQVKVLLHNRVETSREHMLFPPFHLCSLMAVGMGLEFQKKKRSLNYSPITGRDVILM